MHYTVTLGACTAHPVTRTFDNHKEGQAYADGATARHRITRRELEQLHDDVQEALWLIDAEPHNAGDLLEEVAEELRRLIGR